MISLSLTIPFLVVSTDEKTKTQAQGGEVTCPGSHIEDVTALRFEPWVSFVKGPDPSPGFPHLWTMEGEHVPVLVHSRPSE